MGIYIYTIYSIRFYLKMTLTDKDFFFFVNILIGK